MGVYVRKHVSFGLSRCVPFASLPFGKVRASLTLAQHLRDYAPATMVCLVYPLYKPLIKRRFISRTDVVY